MNRRIFFWIASLLITSSAGAVDYHVGPGQAYASIGAVPWYSLQGGDTVFIHYRSAPYKEKIWLSTRGTPTQWIRVLGVKGPNGELPIISGDGATTGPNMHCHWQDAGDIQTQGVVQVGHQRDPQTGDDGPKPGYIEIANLQIQDGYQGYHFTAENGQPGSYDGFTSAIYIRAADSVWVRDCILTNSGQGIFTWSSGGPGDEWWEAYCKNIHVSGTKFFNNGHTNSYTEHQIYMQALDPVIENNYFGPMRTDAGGSQIKDRSAGTIIRYNYISQAWGGYNIDLVEPEDMDSVLNSPHFAHDFVYGNILIDNQGIGGNMIHYNEDHYGGIGRMMEPGGKLSFYNNTILVMADRSKVDWIYIFNSHMGGYDCPAGPVPGKIDMRNNIIAALPLTPGSQAPEVDLGYCGMENIDLGKNWISPGWKNYHSPVSGGTVTGAANVISPANNNPGFADVVSGDLHLLAGSSAIAVAGPLGPDVTSNPLNLDFTPINQYVYHRQLGNRSGTGAGSDLGALAFGVYNPPSEPNGGGNGGNGGGGGGSGGNTPKQPGDFSRVFNPSEGPAVVPCDGGSVVVANRRGKVADVSCVDGKARWDGKGAAAGVYMIGNEKVVLKK